MTSGLLLILIENKEFQKKFNWLKYVLFSPTASSIKKTFSLRNFPPKLVSKNLLEYKLSYW